jgi:hypothetical protein
MDFGPQDLLKALGTIASTFFGAYLAFRFSMRKAQLDREQERISYVGQILLQIIWSRNKIYNIQTQAFDPIRHLPSPHYAARSVLQLDEPPSLAIDVAKLPAGPRILGAAMNGVSAIEYTRNAIRALNTCSKYHLEQFQPELAKLQPHMKDGYISLEDLEKNLPLQVQHTLEQYFSQAMAAADDAETKLEEAEKALFEAAKALYPKVKFVSAELPPRKRVGLGPKDEISPKVSESAAS